MANRKPLLRLLPRYAVLALCAAAPASAQFSFDRVSLESRLSADDLNSTGLTDCWGYVSPSQREYAIVGLSQGTGFIEITNPTSPVVVDIMLEPTLGKDMKVYQTYAYSTSDFGPSYVYDMSDIDNGNVTSLGQYLATGTHNLAVDEVSGFLYHAGDGRLEAYDLTDPENPTLVGSRNGETHDVQVVTYTSGVYAGRQIAFISAGTGGRVDIVDVTDKSAMFLVRELIYPTPSYTHQAWLSGDRRYLYVNDELDDIARTSIFDVSVLESAFFVSDFSNGGTSTDHNLYWHDGYLYVANYSMGMRVFDANDPVNLAEVGYFDTYPANNNLGYTIGAWTAYPYFPSGNVIVTDQQTGFFVLDPTEAITPAAVASRNAGANPASYVSSSVVLGGTWTASVDLSLTGHSFAQIAAFTNPSSVTLGGGQVLLMGGPRLFLTTAQPGPLASWSEAIPNMVSIAGMTAYTQAVHFLGVTPFALSNAQDLTVGYY